MTILKELKRKVICKVIMLSMLHLISIGKKINMIKYKYSLYRSFQDTIKFKDVTCDRIVIKQTMHCFFEVFKKFSKPWTQIRILSQIKNRSKRVSTIKFDLCIIDLLNNFRN